MCEHALLVSSGPSSYIIIYLNKPYIIRNGGEMSNIDYLPIKPENAEYLQNAGTCSSCHFWHFKLHNKGFEQALDHKKWWRLTYPDYLPTKQKM
jgi:hypothetical protein